MKRYELPLGEMAPGVRAFPYIDENGREYVEFRKGLEGHFCDPRGFAIKDKHGNTQHAVSPGPARDKSFAMRDLRVKFYIDDDGNLEREGSGVGGWLSRLLGG